MLPAFCRRSGDDIDIFVRLTPRSSRDALEGAETTSDGRMHLKARVRAVPEQGKANKALLKLIAGTLRVPASSVAIVSGDTARLKTVRISGISKEIEQLLDELGGEATSR
jgi:uncharacterized protein (TIGR00251 family)